MDLASSLSKILVSNTRLKILKLFFEKPKESFYIREVVRITSEELNSVRRELLNLKKAGILKSEPRGNRLFFYLDTACVFYCDFLGLFSKMVGLGGKFHANSTKLGEIKFIIFSQKFLRWEDNKSEVDFLIVGRVVLPEVGALVVKEEEKRGREINYAVMDIEEYKLRKRNQDPFLLNLLLNNPMVIFGDESELAKL